ncbi:hypothetical protein QQ045_030261 [Rhodiola kirilowii]
MELKKQKFRLMQFLTGLNEIHSVVRTQITSIKPRPTLDEAYHMVLNDEMQKGVVRQAVVEMSAMYAAQQQQETQNFQQGNYVQFGQSNSSRNMQKINGQNYSNSLNKNRRALFCTHCQLQGHTKETCYKIHGYPPGHKFYKGNNANMKGTRPAANNVVLADGTDASRLNFKSSNSHNDNNSSQQLGYLRMSHEQIEKLMHFLNMPSHDNEHIAVLEIPYCCDLQIKTKIAIVVLLLLYY